jgi:hypothetical protein
MQKAALAVKGTRPFATALLLVLSFAAVAASANDGAGDVAETSVVSLPSPIGPLTYTPGRGARIGNTGLTLGGYSNLNLTRDEGGPAELVLDDLSLFVVWDPTARFHLFSELEFEDLVSIDDHGRGGTNKWDFTAERLYGDVTFTDALNVRVGKFLTPVGRWNVIHAQPLVWTTSRPLATTQPFDPHSTGAMVFGSVAAPRGSIGYSLYGQFTDQLDRIPEPQLQRRAGGGRVEYTAWHDWSIGVSYLGFEPDTAALGRDVGWRNLVGVDGLWQHGPFEMMGEFAHEESQWGLYLQGVVEVLPQVFLVGRYEHWDQPAPLPAVDMAVTGLAWRPRPYLLLKAEYLSSNHRAEESPPGFKSSVAILF